MIDLSIGPTIYIPPQMPLPPPINWPNIPFGD